jgi:aminoglycoside 3-N-acetyltransferase
MNRNRVAPETGTGRIGYDRLKEELRALGVQAGRHLLVHSSLKAIGWIEGGPAALLEALRAVTEPATLVVPTQTTRNSLTSRAFLADIHGLDDDQQARHIARMPGFDPASTPSQGMGLLAECLRTHPDAVRSSHPQVSFAALGPQAQACVAVHDLDCHLGERSPLAWLEEMDADVLLLGVGYSACTALHLAEYRIGGQRTRPYRCFAIERGVRTEREFTDIYLDDSDFPLLGAELDAGPEVSHGRVGAAPCRLFSMCAAVDFARDWFNRHRRLAIT